LIYDNKKCCQLIFKYGVCAKNLRSVAESIEELNNHIKDSGLDNITEKDLQQIAKLVDSGDKGVRESSLSFIGEVYKVLDEEVWRVLGPQNIKVKGLLEGRFKQVKKGASGLNSSLMNKSINTPSPLERRSIVPPSKSSNEKLN
jgi:DNA phosphorothioation-dependent restriction protein DptG